MTLTTPGLAIVHANASSVIEHPSDAGIHRAERQAGRAYKLDLACILPEKHRGVMTGACHQKGAAGLIQNGVGHADEHVLANVRIELAVHGRKNL